jgi:hypothetical protein
MTRQDKEDDLKRQGWTEDAETGDWVKGDKRFKEIDEAYLAEFKTPPEEL